MTPYNITISTRLYVVSVEMWQSHTKRFSRGACLKGLISSFSQGIT